MEGWGGVSFEGNNKNKICKKKLDMRKKGLKSLKLFISTLIAKKKIILQNIVECILLKRHWRFFSSYLNPYYLSVHSISQS